MRNIWFCINGYMEEELLPDCLTSIRKIVPNAKIVFVEGIYEAFQIQAKTLQATALVQGRGSLANCFAKFTSTRSTDKTIEILKDFKVDKIIFPKVEWDKNSGNEIEKAWPNEHIKRSQYFVGEKGDWYFVIDSDERLIGYFPPLDDLDTSDHWCINLRRDDGILPYPILRIHKHFDRMFYDGAHHAIHCDGQLVKKKDYENRRVLQGCYLEHKWKQRGDSDPIRHQVKGAYYRYLLMAEKEFRDLNGI